MKVGVKQQYAFHIFRGSLSFLLLSRFLNAPETLAGTTKKLALSRLAKVVYLNLCFGRLIAA